MSEIAAFISDFLTRLSEYLNLYGQPPQLKRFDEREVDTSRRTNPVIDIREDGLRIPKTLSDRYQALKKWDGINRIFITTYQPDECP